MDAMLRNQHQWAKASTLPRSLLKHSRVFESYLIAVGTPAPTMLSLTSRRCLRCRGAGAAIETVRRWVCKSTPK